MSSVANRSRVGEYSFYVPPVGLDRYSSRKVLTEDYLRGLSFSEQPRLAEFVGAMYDSLLAGGTRMRPILCLEVANVFGLDPAEVLPSAAAIELLHTGSLVHDNLPVLGNGRGGSGVARHEGSGEATVILIGDAFFSEALRLVALNQEGRAEQIREVVRELATSTGAGGMVGGQAITANLVGRIVDAESLKAAHSYRMCALLVAAARVGAVLGECTADEKEVVSEYARHLGLCARVSADMLNARSRDDTLGADGHETEHEEHSFVQVCGLPGARRLADEALHEALTALDGLDRDTRGLVELAHLAYTGTNNKPVI